MDTSAWFLLAPQQSAAYDTIPFKSTLIPKVQVHGFQKYINFKCTYKLKFSAEKLAISILEVNRRFVISSKMSVGANEVLWSLFSSFHLFPFLEMNQVQRSATHILRIFWNIFSPSNFILVFVTDFFIGFYIFLCPSRGISLFNKCFTTAIYEMKELGTKGSTYMYRYIYRWSEDISILRRTSHKLFSTLILSTRHIHLAALFLLVHISKHHIGTHMT